jgi:hypothetical protein
MILGGPGGPGLDLQSAAEAAFMDQHKGLFRLFILIPAVGGLAGCNLGEGPGGPRELPPENAAVAKVAPRVVKRARLPKNAVPLPTNRDVKGKYAD